MKNYDVIILGAGASGLMCAGNISRKKSVAVIDTNANVAAKVKVSGGGKCNVTNVSVAVENYDGQAALLHSIFKKFDQKKLLQFLQRHNIELELRKGRYYFCKEGSDAIIDALKKDAKNATFYLQEKIVGVTKEGELFCVKTNKRTLFAKNIVVATGGKSFSTLGASDIGLQIAKNFGIACKEFTPALVGLTVQKEQFWMKELSGLSCYVHVKVGTRELQEEMLFTHKGISGPAILSASLYWKKGEISIDFLPNVDIESLIDGKKLVSSALPLPKRLAKALLSAIGFKDKECYRIAQQERKILQQLHCYCFAPAGNFGFSKAEVSRGGVIADELVFNSLESKKVAKLFFIGEVVDVTGELGGYNFQWAFSSGYMCAKQLY